MWSSVKTSWKQKGRKKKVRVLVGDENMSSDVTTQLVLENYGLFVLGTQNPAEEYNIDIVAIHGLGGHWQKTWTDANGKFWLQDFLSGQLPNARIMCFGYNSKTAFTKAVSDIEDASCDLLDRLDDMRQQPIEKARPVVFIAHSLGGIVLKKAMIIAHERSLLYGDLLKCVHGAAFFGVPHRGSEVAYWANFAANLLKIPLLGNTNAKFVAALQKNSEAFANISQQFIECSSSLQIRTFYETKKAYNQLTVDKDSASLGLPNEIAVPIANSGYKNICRFGNFESKKYALVEKSIRKLVNSAVVSQNPSSIPLSGGEKGLLQSLSTSNYMSYKQRNPIPVGGTCKWFFNHSVYRSWWQEQNSSLLWVSADPGCGKSVLASFLVDQLSKQESGTVLHFFFKDDNEKQSATSAICALLHQLFTKNRALVKHGMLEYQNKGQKILRGFHTLWGIFIKSVADPACGKVILIVDGLDECELKTRTLLTRSLVEYFSTENPGRESQSFFKCIITSRPYTSIERVFSNFSSIRFKAEEEAKAIAADVSLVITEKVRRIARDRDLSVSSRFELETCLNKNAKGSFLWVSLVLEMIEKNVQLTTEAFEDLVSTMPNSLDAVYDIILAQSPNIEDTRKMLHIIVAAARPLTLQEMAVSFAIKLSDKSYDDLDLEPDISSTIRDLCGLFVRVIDSKIFLVHQTAKEYLYNAVAPSSPAQTQGPWKYSFHPIESNRLLSTICMTYLLFEDFGKTPPYIPANIPLDFLDVSDIDEEGRYNFCGEHDLLNYAAQYWVAHAQSANISDKNELLASAMKLCEARDTRFRMWMPTLKHSRLNIFTSDEHPNLLTASFLGLVDVVQALLEQGANTEAKEKNLGYTALHLSVAMEVRDYAEFYMAPDFHHYQITRLLLESGAGVNARGLNLETPLIEAVNRPVTSGVVSMLQAAGTYKETLSVLEQGNVEAFSSMTEQEAIVLLLLEYGADVTLEDRQGNTALHWAESWCADGTSIKCTDC
ncbi:hypothetical protein BDD12DRAFT_833045 [Trichophaea hybrida]|nr:hypothetical protein BDD12DRAFT_833045 [Trichophaea hybrida]